MSAIRVLCCWALLGVCAAVAGEGGFAPAPGHEKVPVVFWSHYMPQVGTGQLDANGHADGGTDTFPFVTITNNPNEQHIRYALAAGINGFQMLTFPDPEMYKAARKVFEQTGQMFYVNPQWCDQGEDFDKAVEQMGKFAVAHKDDPHVFRLNGKQVHFFYGALKWAVDPEQKAEAGPAGRPNLKNYQTAGAVVAGSRAELARQRIKAMGAEVMFVPAMSPSDKILLDRTDLGYGKWPAFSQPQIGELRWLRETPWDGVDSWGGGDTRTLADLLVRRLGEGPNKSFLYIPAAWPGYDSSNRAWQAIHCQHYGVRALRDGMRTWVTSGFRQLDFVTWNDVNETMLLPSTRSPFGFQHVIRYYHQLAADGTSPFDEAKTVVAYDPEVLYGDELYFQFLTLPQKNASSCDYIGQVRLENLDGAPVAFLTTRATVDDQRTDAIAEARFDTGALIGRAETLSPVVSLYRAGRAGNERETVYENLRLPPMTLRYNKTQFFTSYVVALDRVAPDAALSLSARAMKDGVVRAATGELVPLTAAVQGSAKLRRLTLAESRLTRAAFRADDTAAALGEGNVGLFLRLRAQDEFVCKLALSEGKIRERFAYHWNLPRVMQTIDAAVCETSTYPHGKGQGKYGSMQDAIGKPVFRLVAPATAKVSLSLPDAAKPFVETTLAELAKGPQTFSPEQTGLKGAFRLELALDAVELNQDYPLPETGTYVRTVNASALDDATRYFHVWALTADDKVAYSRPLALIRTPAAGQETVVAAPDATVPCPLLHTRGIFDDFVDSSSSTAVNPFTAADVVVPALPVRQIPYYLYDFSEGAGTMINDGGTAHQTGRAWLTAEGAQWLADGWRGSGIRLSGGQINLRAKSWPHGAYTFSARIRLNGNGAAGAAGQAGAPIAGGPLAGDGDHWQGITMQGLRIDILPDGTVKAVRQIRDSEGSVLSSGRLGAGWNHLVVTHDLLALRIYLNGKLAGEGAVKTPGYQRTHSTPSIGFSKVAKTLDPQSAATLSGDLDQIEVIGTALTPEAVASLFAKGQWAAR